MHLPNRLIRRTLAELILLPLCIFTMGSIRWQVATIASERTKDIASGHQATSRPVITTHPEQIGVVTLTLPQKSETNSGVPTPSMDLRPGVANYKSSILVGGQTIPLSVKREIKDENGAWTLTESAVSPQGEIVDISTVEKGSLLLKHRQIKQGLMTVDLDFKPNKISGSVTLNSQATPIDADPGGTIFADGAGAFDVVATLPLAEGYSVSYRNFDVQKRKPEMKKLKVIGLERVVVPAGTFDAFKVEIVSEDNEADKQTIWIAKDTRKVVKVAVAIISLGGAMLTSELTN